MSTWKIDPTHSRIGFSVRHLGFAKVRGAFTSLDAELTLDGERLVGGSARIDASSIDTGVADRDKHLRSGDFFDVATWPDLSFASTAIEAKGDGRYTLSGDLTIRDITRPVELAVEVLGTATDPWGNARVAIEARGAIDRRDFGLTWNQALEAGGVLVGHTVELQIEAQAVAVPVFAAAAS